jgi:tetratricopeptide (TPR) repeat protein
VALERLRRLLALQPERLDVRIDVARIEAWRGDLDAAIRRLDGILAEHPGTPAALDARGTFQAWAGRYDAALGSYDELLAISPEGGEVQRQRATVLAWASDYEASLAVWDSLLAVDPDDAEALRGRGRVLSWQGRLLAAERTLRRALDVEPKSVEGRVLLGQNLRWQGRPAAALDVLVEARELDPGDGDARAQLRLVEAALAPRASPRMVVEGDSDDNRMLTSLLTTAWHPLPRLGVRLDLYQRWLDQGELGASASGFSLAADWQLPPGWTVAAGVGQSRNDGGRRETIDGWRASVASPGRHPLRATLVAQRRALDATALLARVGVTLEEVELEASWSPAPPWRVNGALSRATFDGTRENTRTGTALAVTRRVGRPWTFGAAVRGFSFERDLADGYFDPDRYDIAELTARWLWEPGAWSLRAEGAPGVQRVGAAGDPAGTLRLSGRVALRLAPGRELSFSAGYSSTGLQSFSTGDSDYRYLALVLGASWVF